MKSIFAITAGICMLATAGAADTATQLDPASAVMGSTTQVSTSEPTATEVKALQEKFRYYPASNYSSLRAPI
jgi:hypothetical protein